MLSTKQSYALCAIGVLVLFGILVAVCETGAISLYVKGILMTCCIAVIMTTSLNLTIGVLGQLTLGCCGFEAIGAYSAALMSKLLVANGVQMDDTVRFLLVTFVGALLSGISYRKSRRQAYFLLLCFYGCFALGALYWTLYLLLFDTTPQVFYVSEFGWVASVIFLHILQATLAGTEERGFRCRRAWLAPAFGVPLLTFYCAFGDILSNLIWCGMMIWLSYCAIRGLAYAETRTGAARNMRYFHIGVLCFTFAEYLLWTAGCFWPDTSPATPTFWCDMLLTFAILGLLPATRKAVEL